MPFRARLPRLADARGQASVELVALLPLVAVVGLVAWQAAVAGHAMWSAGVAVRAAARASAIADEAAGRAAARRLLPARVGRGMRLEARDDGEVTLRVAVPSVVGGGRLATWSVRTRMEPQR